MSLVKINDIVSIINTLFEKEFQDSDNITISKEIIREILSIENIEFHYKKKMGKTIKDPNAPKKPPNAFLIFCNNIRSELKSQNPDFNHIKIIQKIAEIWKNNNVYQEEKKLAYEKENKLKDEYKQKIKIYKESLLEKSKTCICGNIGNKKCEKCYKSYCSRDCQLKDWKEHKKNCIK